MRKTIAIVLLLFVLFAAMTLSACGGLGGSTDTNDPTQSISAYNFTATFGAEQFYIQLTAVADQQ